MAVTFALFIFCSSSVLVGSFSQQTNDELLFEDFVKKYGRTYSGLEKEHRFQIFRDTLMRIRNLNDDHSDIELNLTPFGITRYADLTPDEFRHTVLTKRKIHHQKMRRKRAVIFGPRLPATRLLADLPKRVDWRDSKVINPVRNQGECGACWALSTVETLESMYAIKTGSLPLISVQQVVDCAEGGNLGCQGGDTCLALMWLNSTRARLVPEAEYPFKQATGVCKLQNSSTVFQLKDYTCDDYTNKEDIMLQLLATHGPLVVAVDAVMWQDYLGGIIRFHCEAAHNHAVQIVGYDATGPVPYYILRNSWGTDFGIDGYLNVAIGSNLCGIANEVSTVEALV